MPNDSAILNCINVLKQNQFKFVYYSCKIRSQISKHQVKSSTKRRCKIVWISLASKIYTIRVHLCQLNRFIY